MTSDTGSMPIFLYIQLCIRFQELAHNDKWKLFIVVSEIASDVILANVYCLREFSKFCFIYEVFT